MKTILATLSSLKKGDDLTKLRKMPPAPTVSILLFGDLISIFFTLLPAVVGWGGAVAWVRHFLDNEQQFWLALLASPFVLIALFISSLFVLRVLLPKLKPGVYPAGANLMFITWYAHVALSRAAKVSALQTLLQSFAVTRYFFWRALGTKVAFRSTASLHVNMVDYPLITIEEGATLADRVQISCHSFVGDRLFLGPVRVGKQAFVGMECMVGAKTDIGEGVWIGVHNVLFRDKLPDHSRLENFQWQHGSALASEQKKKPQSEDSRPE